ncbi:MAG: outer membrane protein assembly factor BamC [Nitrococcus sp.]|nr:outer membrane protein assembly factor BamC [Nitrococcus sp.]
MSRPILVLLAVLSLLALAGCTSGADPAERTADELTLPPDLSPEQQSSAMAIPAGAQASTGTGQESSTEPVLPEPDHVTLRRDGHERWLEVQAPPSQVWRWVGRFVKQRRLTLARSDPKLGIMETTWLYSAKPLEREALAPSTVDREEASIADRYLIRLEEGVQQGTTEVFVAHRRVARDEQGKWHLRNADRFLEAELMRALLISLGGDSASPSTSLTQGDTDAVEPRLRELRNGTAALILHDGFFEAWRRIGLALDRAGFTVVDRDRSARHYFIRYDTRAELGPKDEGLLDTVAFWSNEIPDTLEKYRIDLTEVKDVTQVTVHRVGNAPSSKDIAVTILQLVQKQLR